jgi:hypothetical protein
VKVPDIRLGPDGCVTLEEPNEKLEEITLTAPKPYGEGELIARIVNHLGFVVRTIRVPIEKDDTIATLAEKLHQAWNQETP